jgi:hypothetical protein
MKLKIEIDLDNAAFEPEFEGHEVARILHEMAEEIDYIALHPSFVRHLQDINGNSVGKAKVVR